MTDAAKKPNIFKAVLLGLSAYIVRAAVFTALGLLGMKSEAAAGVISNVVVIVFGAFYYNYCVTPLGNRVRLFDNKKLPLSVLLSVTLIAAAGVIIAGWFVYGGAFGSVSLIAASVGESQYSSVFAGISDSYIFPLCVYLIFFVPVAEELIYRGFFFRQLYAVNKPTAYYMSVVFFAASHGNIIRIIAAAFGGILYAMLYAKTKSLRVAIFAHMLYNAFALFAAFLGTYAQPYGLYNAFGVSLIVSTVIISFIFVYYAPTGLEIARLKTLTPEERAEREASKIKYDRAYREFETEKMRTRQIEREARTADKKTESDTPSYERPETNSESEQIILGVPSPNGKDDELRIYIDA